MVHGLAITIHICRNQKAIVKQMKEQAYTMYQFQYKTL